jgi:copper chaperone NosL
MNRRNFLSLSLAGIAGAPLVPIAVAQAQGSHAKSAGDGTPVQFLPRHAPDPKPQENDLAKFPKCPYCGMDRRQYHHSRMLVHYGNDVPDAVCSIHCAAISLSLNIDAEPKAIWVGDNAAAGEPKPLVDVDQASFVIGGSTMGVMTLRSKVAYGSEAAAKSAQAAQGGVVGDFNAALLAAYTDMSRDVARIRQNREERRKRTNAMPKS